MHFIWIYQLQQYKCQNSRVDNNRLSHKFRLVSLLHFVITAIRFWTKFNAGQCHQLTTVDNLKLPVAKGDKGTIPHKTVTFSSATRTLSMSGGNDEFMEKHEILQEKYKALRRKHKKLAGVALELAQALEAFIKEDEKPDMNKVLLSCSNIYPGLITSKEGSLNEVVKTEEPEEVADVEGKEQTRDDEVDSEKSEKEYYEGFWSRPKIPRTPQT